MPCKIGVDETSPTGEGHFLEERETSNLTVFVKTPSFVTIVSCRETHLIEVAPKSKIIVEFHPCQSVHGLFTVLIKR
jgi:UPF0288 family protein (methanogenesis marker protein 3)